MGISSLLLLIGASACTWVASQAAESAFETSSDLRSLFRDLEELDELERDAEAVPAVTSGYCTPPAKTDGSAWNGPPIPEKFLNAGELNDAWKAKKPISSENSITPCCSAANKSPHAKDENGNYVDFVHGEDAWAFAVFEAVTSTPALCQDLVKMTRGLSNKKVKACSRTKDGLVSREDDCVGVDCKWVVEEKENGEKEKFLQFGQYKSKSCDYVNMKDAGLFEELDDEDEEGKPANFITRGQRFLYDLATATEIDPSKANCAKLFKSYVLGDENTPPYTYFFFDGTSAGTKWGYQAEAWQAWLQSTPMFDWRVGNKENGGTLQAHHGDADGPTYRTNNGAKKGRGKECKAWSTYFIQGDGLVGTTTRREPEGGLSSQFFQCKIQAINMAYDEVPTGNGETMFGEYVPGKNKACRGQQNVPNTFRACEAPFVMGISGTIAHTLRTMVGGNEKAATAAQILATISSLILGGHHTLTELAITGSIFSRWQSTPESRASPKVDKPVFTGQAAQPDSSWETPDPAATGNDMSPSNSKQYKLMVKAMYQAALDVLGDPFKKALGDVQDYIPDCAKRLNINEENEGKEFHELVEKHLPFWVDGEPLLSDASGPKGCSNLRKIKINSEGQQVNEAPNALSAAVDDTKDKYAAGKINSEGQQVDEAPNALSAAVDDTKDEYAAGLCQDSPQQAKDGTCKHYANQKAGCSTETAKKQCPKSCGVCHK